MAITRSKPTILIGTLCFWETATLSQPRLAWYFLRAVVIGGIVALGVVLLTGEWQAAFAIWAGATILFLIPNDPHGDGGGDGDD